jgi:hypothetical protein
MVERLKSDIQYPQKCMVRCLGHIINLTARAFLFGNDPASLEAEIPNMIDSSIVEAQLDFWRQKKE